MFSGILLINKPPDTTSFDVINRIKKRFKIKKIGHAGTLDYFATGLLIAGINEGTKLLSLFMEREKVYQATFILGKTTDTLDETGKVVYEHSGTLPSLSLIEQELNSFKGELLQKPPEFSAVKIGGKRASDLIRSGKKIELEARPVSISEIKVLNYKAPEIAIEVRCSKGTYIRAVARDLGEKLGCGAYVKKLVRTEISPYRIEDAKSLSEILNCAKIEDVAVPLIDSLPFMKKLELSEIEKEYIKKGVSLEKQGVCEVGKMLAVNTNDAVAVVEVVPKDGFCQIRPIRVFN